MKLSNVLIVDDQRIMAESLKELLKSTGKFNQVTSVHTGEMARHELLTNKYDYLVSDLIMPGFDVKEFIASTRASWPEMNILVITSSVDIINAKEVLSLGANAYLSKYISAVEFNLALEKVQAGERYISTDLAVKVATASIAEKKNTLTKRELEIVRYVAQGYPIAKIAAQMHLSQYTVVTHRRNIMEKLGFHSALEIVKFAYENKLV